MREGHVDRAGAPVFGVVRKGEQAVGRDADQGIEQIEGDEIAGDEHAEAADHGQQPAHAEALVRRAAAPDGGGDDDPEQGRDSEQQRAGRIEAKREAEAGQVEGNGRGVQAQQTGREGGRGRDPLQRQRARRASP